MAFVKGTLICLFIYLLFGCFVAPTTEKNACHMEQEQNNNGCDTLLFLYGYSSSKGNIIDEDFKNYILMMCLLDFENKQKCKNASNYKPDVTPN